MEYIVIDGNKPLRGDVYINGAKNAAVAMIPAAIACGGICVIDNLPDIEDVHVLIGAAQTIGVKCEFMDKHKLLVDSSNITSCTMNYDSVKQMRASYYLLGALLGRFGQAAVPIPGGCNLGVRPIDLHIKGFEALGAKIVLEHGVIHATADKLVGTNIYLDCESVGATINIMLAAVYAEGVTIIENAAKEPHVVDTANFLNILGAKIKGAGTDTIRITGVKALHGGEYTIIPDQIEAGTYMIAAAITNGDVTVKNIIPKHMESLSAKLVEMNCKVTIGDDEIRVSRDGELIAANIKTMPYPGFPTDLQPQITTMLTLAKGTSIVRDNIWDRFQYITELKRLGCHITVEGRVAIVKGTGSLTGAQVNATDLRAGASLVMAGLAADGTTTIGNIKYIKRGYEAIVEKLRSLGAEIRIEDRPENGEGGR